jgi:hypothetical protein
MSAGRALAVALFLVGAPSLRADDVQVDRQTLSLDDTVTITVTLTDAFASADTFRLPLHNLAVDGAPSVSSEFTWMNGQSTRRKIYRYTAHPLAPGTASIGPVTLTAGAQTETLAAVSLEVLADRTTETNDPARILRELVATGRDPIFVVAEADQASLFAGEQVVVTWTLYNAASVQQYGVSELPKLADFWTEELDVRGEEPREIALAGRVVQKLVVRRAALFPLRSGSLTVEPMSIDAQLMKRSDSGSLFSIFEGSVVDVHRRSAPLTLDVRPLPAGPPVAAVGDVSLQCSTPVQKNGGPVLIDVVETGAANLRAAPPPSFAARLDGAMQMVEGGVTVQRRGTAVMTRGWRFQLLPSAPGMFVVPPLVTTILTPAGTRRELRCDQRTLLVEAADPAALQPPAAATRTRSAMEPARRILPFAALAAAVLFALAIIWPRLDRARRRRRDTNRLLHDTPSETRNAVDAWLATRGVDPVALLRENSDRADAYRALRSLLDGAERLTAEPREIRARVGDVVFRLSGANARDQVE